MAAPHRPGTRTSPVPVWLELQISTRMARDTGFFPDLGEHPELRG